MESFATGDLLRLGLALALGLLIGLQRGWAMRGQADGSRFAGIRTYGLLGLAGGIAGLLQDRASVLAAVLLAATAALVVLGYWRSTRGNRSISGTASLSGLITLAAGYLAGSGGLALASALTGLTVLLLSQRARLHHALRHIDAAEMAAIARFALLALVILPLLPDSPMGPFGAWRPRQLWLVVVLVSGFSFAGYAGVRLLGPARGVLATAAAGAMVSSTAVTASLGGKLREAMDDPARSGGAAVLLGGAVALLNGAVALASAVMFVRVMLLCAVLAPFALPGFVRIALPGMLVSLIGTVLLLRRADSKPESRPAELAVRNPFELKPALLLVILTMALTVAAQWVLARYGDAGLATVLAIAGTVDVDSAVITMGNLPPGTLDARLAALVLAVPVALNTLFKSATLLGLAGRKGMGGLLTLLASLVAMGAGVLLV
ncbi:MAG: DUF4010 domain-containing protein [Novosphingobium sp.]|uniref:MgtC/SapB family protein n=1 Tax=Novosphingobium sp. TaxID=1874826 RepID=UPI0032BDD717